MRPVLVINPLTDDAFRRATAAVLDAAPDDIYAAQRLLRLDYPRAVIRARDLSDESVVVWYVYREGVWVSG